MIRRRLSLIGCDAAMGISEKQRPEWTQNESPQTDVLKKTNETSKEEKNSAVLSGENRWVLATLERQLLKFTKDLRLVLPKHFAG